MGMILTLPLIGLACGTCARAEACVTALGEIMAAEIAARGRCAIDEFMARCLTDPAHGYNTRVDPFGVAAIRDRAGSVADVRRADRRVVRLHWEVMGKPKRLSLVEIGPGRGTLNGGFAAGGARVGAVSRRPRGASRRGKPVLRERQAAMLKDEDVRVHCTPRSTACRTGR